MANVNAVYPDMQHLAPIFTKNHSKHKKHTLEKIKSDRATHQPEIKPQLVCSIRSQSLPILVRCTWVK